MSEEEIIEILRTRLSLETKTSSNYTGDMDGSGSLYRDSVSVLLMFDGEVISEVSI